MGAIDKSVHIPVHTHWSEIYDHRFEGKKGQKRVACLFFFTPRKLKNSLEYSLHPSVQGMYVGLSTNNDFLSNDPFTYSILRPEHSWGSGSIRVLWCLKRFNKFSHSQVDSLSEA